MFKRFISLYYASIDIKGALKLLLMATYAPLFNSKRYRMAFGTLVKKDFDSSEVYPCSTARGALALFLKSMNLSQGDEVILSAFTCLAVPTAIIEAGAIPKYVDIDPNSLNTSSETILNSISTKTRAIIIQHTLGNPAQVNSVLEYARKNDIFVIEDAALSLNSSVKSAKVGSAADAAIFSFELSKTLSTGWGGLLLVNDSKLRKDIDITYSQVTELGYFRVLKDAVQTSVSALGHQPNFHFVGKYLIYAFFKLGLFRYSNIEDETELQFKKGFQFKMSGTCCLFAQNQWRGLNAVSEKCQSNYNYIKESLLDCGYIIPDKSQFEDEPKRVSSRISLLTSNREEFIMYFNNNGIEVGLWFDGPLTPIPTKKEFNYNPHDYPNASRIASNIVNLPCHSRLRKKDLIKIKNTISQFDSEYPKAKFIS